MAQSDIIPVHFDQVVTVDSQGAGRTWIGAVMLEDRFRKLGIRVPVIPVGLNPPVSGARTMNRDVARMLQARGYEIDPDRSFIRQLNKEMLTEKTLVIGFTDEQPPEYLPQTVLEWIVEYKNDPFPGREPGPDFLNGLDELATKIYFDVWFLEQIIRNHPEQIGENKRQHGIARRRELASFDPELNRLTAFFEIAGEDFRHVVRRPGIDFESPSHTYREQEPSYRRH